MLSHLGIPDVVLIADNSDAYSREGVLAVQSALESGADMPSVRSIVYTSTLNAGSSVGALSDTIGPDTACTLCA